MTKKLNINMNGVSKEDQNKFMNAFSESCDETYQENIEKFHGPLVHKKIEGKLKEYIPSEEWEQRQTFIWAKGHQIEMPELKWLNGSINGFRLTPKLILKTKAQGVRKGYPDINLPVRNKEYTGLYIELKRIKGGRLSQEQKEWKEHLNSQGYLCVTCKGHIEAIQVIRDYLGYF